MGHKTLFITTIVQMGRQALPDVIGSLVFLLKRAMDISFSLAGEREKEKNKLCLQWQPVCRHSLINTGHLWFFYDYIFWQDKVNTLLWDFTTAQDSSYCPKTLKNLRINTVWGWLVGKEGSPAVWQFSYNTMKNFMVFLHLTASTSTIHLFLEKKLYKSMILSVFFYIP